jgi:hypothetical protein
MNREGVHAAGKFVGQSGVDHAMAFQAGLAGERLSYDIKAEVRLPLRPVAGMTDVEMRFVHDIEPFRTERRRKLSFDIRPDRHDAATSSF